MVDMTNFVNRRDYHNKRLSALKVEFDSFRSHYQELSEYIQPRAGRFTLSDRNRGSKRHNKIINSHATMALMRATSGLMANLTSPARPWFRLETPDPDLMEYGPVALWLHHAQEKMQAIFQSSNLYNALPTLYEELLLMGTGNLGHVDDFETVARFYPHTAGTYYIAQNARFEIDTVYREFEMQVSQIVAEFGTENVSPTVKNMWDLGNYDSWYAVVHVTEPNPNYDLNSPISRHKRFRSVYFERGDRQGTVENPHFLSEKGFDEFPMYVPRWNTTGADIYGTNCPGMTSLGDVKSLQIEERRKAQAIDKLVNPPLKGPGSLKNIPVSSLPGGLTTYDNDTTREGLLPIYQITPDINAIMLDIQATERRIDDAFYVDLFLAISNMEGIQPRNQLEIFERNQEKLLMLGPVIERLHDDLLDKLIDRTFAQMVRASLGPDGMWKEQGGVLRPPPPELSQQYLKVQYISTLAMAQRAVGTSAIQQTAAFVGGLAGATGDMGTWDKYNVDQAIDDYSRLVGVSPRILRSDDEVAEIRQARQQAQQQMQQMAMLQQGAQTAAQGAQAAKTMTEAQKVGNS